MTMGLAIRLPNLCAAERQNILRISMQDGAGILTLKIEGKVVGDLASEFERIWASLLPFLGRKKLSVDICLILYLDDKGKRILREIVETTGAEVLADSPLTKQFAHEARQKLRKNDGEEK
jgi:hypothetical protein